ncbi:MAG: hypothetical protein LBF40_08045, partial [Deltaproteobacteria bacterium]|nr:hypothetical protein [Deltaproteobacteria bacterium]
MRVFFPIIEAGSLCILNSWTSPLLHRRPLIHFGVRQTEQGFDLGEDPPMFLAGTKAWGCAVELATRGREIHFILSRHRSMGGPSAFPTETTIRILAREDHNLPLLPFHLSGRPPLEIQDPKLILAFHQHDGNAIPLDFSEAEKEWLRGFMDSQPLVMALVHPWDRAFFEQGARNNPLEQAPRPEGGAPGGRRHGGDNDAGGRYRGGRGEGRDQRSHRHFRKREEPTPFPGWKMFLQPEGEHGHGSAVDRVIPLPWDGPWAPFAASIFGLYPFRDEQIVPDAVGAREAPPQMEPEGLSRRLPFGRGWRRLLRSVIGHPPGDHVPRAGQEPSRWEARLSKDIEPDGLLFGALANRKALFQAFHGYGHVLATGPAGSGKGLLGLLFLAHHWGKGGSVCHVASSRAAALDQARAFCEFIGDFLPERPLQPDDVLFLAPGTDAWGDPHALRAASAVFVAACDCQRAFLDEGFVSGLMAVAIHGIHRVCDTQDGVPLDLCLARLALEAWVRRRDKLEPLRIMALSHREISEDKVLISALSLRNSPFGKVVLPPLVLTGTLGKVPSCEPVFQASYSKARFRALGLSDLKDPGLSPASFLLDNSRGSNFKNIAVGWMSPHGKVVYSSPATTVLFGFVKFVYENGRSKVASVKERPGLLEALGDSLAADGIAAADREYYLNLFLHGMFFHYELLGDLSNAIMLEAFRTLSPERNEPFIMSATGTLAYGPETGASALFLDAIFWPRRGLSGTLSMELMDQGFASSYLGQLTPPERGASLAFVNWPMWNGYEKADRFQFGQRKGKLACLFQPTGPIGLGPYLVGTYLDFQRRLSHLSDYPPAVQEFFLHALHHATSKRRHGNSGNNGHNEARPADMAEYLMNTLTVRDFLDKAPAGASDLANRLINYYGLVHSLCPGLLLKETRDRLKGESKPNGKGSTLTYGRGELLGPMLERRVDLGSLLALRAFFSEFPEESSWRGPALMGLAALLAIPLCRGVREGFPRAFHLPSIIREDELSAARNDSVKAHLYFQERSKDFTDFLESIGTSALDAREMALRLQSCGVAAVRAALGRKKAQGRQDPRVYAVVRDQVLEWLFTLEVKLLRWLNGEGVSDIQETLCPSDCDIGEKRADIPFDRQYRTKILDILECFILLTRHDGAYPEASI